MVDLYVRYLRAISRRRLLKKVNEAAASGYRLVGNIERRPFAWVKWRATMRYEGAEVKVAVGHRPWSDLVHKSGGK